MILYFDSGRENTFFVLSFLCFSCVYITLCIFLTINVRWTVRNSFQCIYWPRFDPQGPCPHYTLKKALYGVYAVLSLVMFCGLTNTVQMYCIQFARLAEHIFVTNVLFVIASLTGWSVWVGWLMVNYILTCPSEFTRIWYKKKNRMCLWKAAGHRISAPEMTNADVIRKWLTQGEFVPNKTLFLVQIKRLPARLTLGTQRTDTCTDSKNMALIRMHIKVALLWSLISYSSVHLS